MLSPTFRKFVGCIAGSALGLCAVATASSALARDREHWSPAYGYDRRVAIDRSRPGWWRGDPAFAGYVGPRPGYYFAPGYGYYIAPPGDAPPAWVVGIALPLPMRRYIVVEPTVYGLAPPPPGYGWYYAGTSFVLAQSATGVIVQSVAGGW